VSDHSQAPALRILRGDPSAEELAALVAVLAAASGAAEAPEPARDESQWAPPARLVRAPMTPSGWWASALPG
jgi:hypothetical protein